MLSKDQMKFISTIAAMVVALVVAWFLLKPKEPTPQLATTPRQRPTPQKPVPPPSTNADQTHSDPIYIAIAPLPRPQPATRPATQPTLDEEEMMLAELEALLDEELAATAPPEPLVPLAIAREALAYVGSDPQAEQVWLAAINDPMHSAEIRRELITALNHEGFPANLTPDDLPLIHSRIVLLEEIAPDALDESNAAAFVELYNDLVNLALRLTPPPPQEQ
jgi:hypothetical protein